MKNTNLVLNIAQYGRGMLSKRTQDTILNMNTESSATQRVAVLVVTFLFFVLVIGSLRKAILSEELDYYKIYTMAILFTIWYGISLLLP